MIITTLHFPIMRIKTFTQQKKMILKIFQKITKKFNNKNFTIFDSKNKSINSNKNNNFNSNIY